MNSVRKIQYGVGVVFLLLCMARVGAAQTTCNPVWNSTSVYTAGMKVSLNGVNYTANFWTQGQSPATNNGGAGSGNGQGSTADDAGRGDHGKRGQGNNGLGNGGGDGSPNGKDDNKR